MASACEVCGKSPQMGNSITTRGKAKYLGGVGTKVTGISRRQFKPNLQRIRVTVRGSNKTMRVCTQCIRGGAVAKLVRAAPFKLPTDGGKAGKTGAGKTHKAVKAPAKPKAKAPARAKAPAKS